MTPPKKIISIVSGILLGVWKVLNIQKPPIPDISKQSLQKPIQKGQKGPDTINAFILHFSHQEKQNYLKALVLLDQNDMFIPIV